MFLPPPLSLSLYLSLYLSLSLSISLSLSLSISLYLSLSRYLFFCLSVSICPSLYVCLSLCLSLSLSPPCRPPTLCPFVSPSSSHYNQCIHNLSDQKGENKVSRWTGTNLETAAQGDIMANISQVHRYITYKSMAHRFTAVFKLYLRWAGVCSTH